MIKCKKALLRTIPFAFLLSISVSSTAKGLDVFELSLKELMNTPVQVAAKRDTNITQSPSSISVFTAQQLSSMGITHLVQLLNIIPGFYAMYNPVEGNQSYIITRGHSQKYASNILFLVNGQRLNDDYTGGISYFNRFLPLTFVKRVEVIRGPGSALYGSNAFNGVVNIITQPQSSISAKTSSFDGYGGSLGINQEIQQAEISLGIQYHTDQGDDIDIDFDRFGLQNSTQDPREQLHIDLQVRHHEFTWQTLYYDSNREDYYLFRRLRDGTTELNLSQFSTGITWETSLNEQTRIKTSAQYQSAHRDSLTALAVQDPTDFPEADFLFGEDIDYESTRVALDVQIRISETQQWDNGFEWLKSQIPNGFIRSNYNLFGADEYLGEVVTFKNNDQRVVLDKIREIKSVYSQLESQWNHDTSTMLGVRYDHYNDSGAKWSPRLAIVHSYSPETTLKLMYSEAYRAPSLGDLYDEESGLTIGRATLNPSTLQSTEISYSYIQDHNAINIVLFNNDIHDLIGFRTQNNNTFLDNITDSHSQGLEWNWTWILSSNLKLKNQATHIFNITSDSEGSEITPLEDLTPRHYGISEIHWKINPNINSYIGIHWRDTVDILHDDDYLMTWHAQAQYSFQHNQSLVFTIHNLFDEAYSTGSAVQLGTLNNGNDYQEYPARGREWVLEYKWLW